MNQNCLENIFFYKKIDQKKVTLYGLSHLDCIILHEFGSKNMFSEINI